MQEVREFLKNRTIFITGATGFLGQPLVEKILWSTPSVRKIYVLIRPKKQFGGRILTASARLKKELHSSSVFDRLRHRYRDQLDEILEEKVVAVSGDISKQNFGLDEPTLAKLREEISVVINSAAVVSFDAPLDESLELNVFGALRVCRFAKSCRDAILLHVSTAYVSGAAKGSVSETMHHTAEGAQKNEEYPERAFSDIDAEIEKIRSIIEEVREESEDPEIRRSFTEAMVKRGRKRKGKRLHRRRQQVEILRQRWISERLAERGMAWARERGWNDTYTYTKALGEQVVARAAEGMPTGICRPSVIESSLSEPSPGWLDGLRMADPLIVAIGKGRLKALPLDPDVSLDLVPADMVVNAILAALPQLGISTEILIFHVATGSTNPITLGELYRLILAYFQTNPMLDKDGQPIEVKSLKFPKPSTFRLQHRLRAVPLGTVEKTLEALPSIEAAQRIRRKVSAAKTAYEKLYYYGEIYEPYLNLNCSFEVHRALELLEGLSDEEQRLFDFDVRRLNWRHYVQNVHIPGVKKHILKLEGTGTYEPSELLEEETECRTIRDLLDVSIARRPEKPALQLKEGNEWRGYTYRELGEAADHVAGRLASLGLQKGDRVLLFSENQPAWGAAYMGCATLGIVVVPLDAQTWHREVWAIGDFTGAKAILMSAKGRKRLKSKELDRNEEADCPLFLCNVDEECLPFRDPERPRSCPSLEETTGALEKPEISPDDVASIIFTTGTAVDPRGAVHTHRSFLNNLRGVDHHLSISDRDHLLSVLPLYHALEFSCGFLMAIYRQATVTYARSLKPRVILETMRETGTTCMLGVPTLYNLIREDIERRILKTSKSTWKQGLMETSKQLSRSVQDRFGRNIGKSLFSRVYEEFGGNIRVFVSGGSALGRKLYRDFQAMGLTVYEGYGLTETAPVLTVNPLSRSREGSAGMPLPGVEMRLYRPDRDGIGEIIVRTPSIMKEYFRNPTATAAVLRDGWFHTGDLGWVDADGYLYITGRLKDVIVTGAGKNVYPMDLEGIYRELPSIAEITVFGVKSGLTEDVYAAIVTAETLSDLPSRDRRQRVQQEIQELARELPSYHRLQSIHLWEGAFPRTQDGEVDREELRSRILKKVGKEPSSPRVGKARGHRERLLEELARLSATEPSEIGEDTNLYSDLGLDSLMAVELLLFIERELDISVSDERAAGFQTVGDLFDELRRRSFGNGESSAPTVDVRSALALEERPFLDRKVLGISFALLKSLFRTYFSLRVAGVDGLPKAQPYVIAANHASHLDSAAVVAALSLALGVKRAKRLHVIGARDYFFDSAFKSWLFSTCLNVVPIEREEIGLKGLRMVGSILKKNEPVLIFPEGTRSRDGTLQSFKPGVGLIVWEYQVPVIPTYIEGAHHALPPGNTVPRREPLSVSFGEALEMKNYESMAEDLPRDELYRRIAADLRREILSLSKEGISSVELENTR